MTTTVQNDGVADLPAPVRTRAEWVAAIGMPLAVFGVYISLLPAINAALALRLNA